MREKCIHAVNPAPAPPSLTPPRWEAHHQKSSLPFPSLPILHTCWRAVISFSPPLCRLFLPSLPPSVSLPSVISPAWLQGRIKAERRRREMGARKSGMEGGVALFSRGEREDRAALTHLQTPTEICSTRETHEWQLHTLTDDEPTGVADVTNESY